MTEPPVPPAESKKPIPTEKVISDEENVHIKIESAANDQESEDDPEIAALPRIVRQMVSLTDNPELPTITFRYFVLSAVFVIPGRSCRR